MAPLTTGAPTPPAHAIRAQAHPKPSAAHRDRHAAPTKSVAPKRRTRHAPPRVKRPVRTAATYRVRPGDNLSAIARRQGVSLAALVKANHVKNPDRTLSGSTLRIPRTPVAHRSDAPRKRTAPAERPKPTTSRKASRKQPARRPAAKQRHATGASAAVRRTRAALADRPAPGRIQVKHLIEHTARRYGVNPRLAMGIGYQESGWNQRAVSPVNAVGTMQVLPQSGHWASGLVGRDLDLLDTHDNVTAGVAILRYLTGNAKNLDQAIGAYYQGLGGIREHGPYRDTRAYVRNVRAIMDRL